LLHCNRCAKDGSRYGATSVAGIPLKIATWIELAAQRICFTFFNLFHYGATRLLERLLWMWGQALRDSDHLWLNAL
jgi:hypothetical protein